MSPYIVGVAALSGRSKAQCGPLIRFPGHPPCRQYLTGFRKRKQQRRKDALSQLEKQAKEERLAERAEVRSLAGRLCDNDALGAQKWGHRCI